ncbi:helix-turn-helix domain-containing protein [Streptomyces sp. NBC_01571]|uniref:helix-turn-helix domain-containing protein n=1 Tax=Streptomyces sp. NBC_01571 TaxID=2975883 RepID=UPI0022557D01|nr:helix-turn-helix domain-containing protein [Streptomyces sp. NBC_01571]MCX4578463.1 helix-turn-helix domain-containing protein [Streptomyces sp. NBC_01571]
MTSGMGTGPVLFSTVGLPEGQRVALWEAHNAAALIGVHCRSLRDDALEATEINLQLPHVHLARVAGSPHVVERSRSVVRNLPSDAIACYFALTGDAFFYHDDGVRVLHPGQLIVCDADRPFIRGFSQGLEELAVKVPRSVWRDLGGPQLSQPMVFDVDEGAAQARVLARMVDRAVLPKSSEAVEEDIVLELLGSVVSGRPPTTAAVHLATARAYIDEHLTEPGLSAAHVARGIGVSERHLSRVFAHGGESLPQYLLGRRLDRARSMLAAGWTGSVAEAGAACGFGSASYFSHRFKERHGVGAADVLRGGRVGG